MGNIQINSQLFSLNKHTWQMYSQTNYKKIMIDSQTGTLASSLIVSNYDQHDINCLKLRAQHSAFFVNVLAIFKDCKSVQCNVFQCPTKVVQNRPINVLIENIQYRLPDLGNITYQQSIYILTKCLHAIKILQDNYQGLDFQLQEEMIGFNAQKQCKFWADVNYWKSLTITQQINTLQNYKIKQNRLRKLFQIVQNKMHSINKFQQKQYYEVKRNFLSTGEQLQKYDIINCINLSQELCSINNVDIKNLEVNIPDQNQTNIIIMSSNKHKAANTYKNKQDNSEKLQQKACRISLKSNELNKRKNTRAQVLNHLSQTKFLLTNNIQILNRLRKITSPKRDKNHINTQNQETLKNSRSTYMTSESRQNKSQNIRTKIIQNRAGKEISLKRKLY